MAFIIAIVSGGGDTIVASGTNQTLMTSGDSGDTLVARPISFQQDACHSWIPSLSRSISRQMSE
jgi:hypothetical protein